MPDERFAQAGFKCPHCGREAQQNWFAAYAKRLENGQVNATWLSNEFLWATAQQSGQTESFPPGFQAQFRDVRLQGTHSLNASQVDNLSLSVCYSCKRFSVWHCDKIVVPSQETDLKVHPDLPAYCRTDFSEACAVASSSPRAAAALLRACMEKLLIDLTQKETPAEAIQDLIVRGIDPSVAQAMDIVRVTGNKALHGYQLAEDEINAAPVDTLIDLLNYIVEDRITKPAQMASLFAKLPDKDKLAIEKRNGKLLPPKPSR